jgi:hypothetical protein
LVWMSFLCPDGRYIPFILARGTPAWSTLCSAALFADMYLGNARGYPSNC